MIQLKIKELFVVRCLSIVLKWYTAQENEELDIFHLVWPNWISNRIDNCHHWLCIDSSDVHYRDFKAYFFNKFLTLFTSDISFLVMCEWCIDSLNLWFVLFKYFIDLDCIALISPKVLTVHSCLIRVDILLQNLINDFMQLLWFVLLDLMVGHSTKHF